MNARQVFGFVTNVRSDERLNSPVVAWLASFLFFAFALGVADAHEMWRDEAQAWMIAAESHNLTDLWLNTGQEGHPPLWHLLLWFLTSLHLPVFSMHVLQASLGALGCWFVFRHAPLTIFEKIGICFGYFYFYEWTIIARNYLGGIVFLFVALSHWEVRKHRELLKSCRFYLPLSVSAMFNIFNLGIAFAIGIGLLIEAFRERRYRNWFEMTALGFAGILSAYSIARANIGMQSHSGFNTSAFTLDSISRGFLHFADNLICLNVKWWPSSQIDSVFVPMLKVVSYAGAVGLIFAVWKRFWLGVLFFISVLSCYAVLFGLKDGGARHSAYVWVSAICVFWLVLSDPDLRENISRTLMFRLARATFFLGLCAQVILNYRSSREDIQHPFSSSRDAAYLIARNAADNGFSSFEIAGITDWGATPVAAYLNRAVFSPYRQKEERYVRWGERRYLNAAEAMNILKSKLVEFNGPTYLILNENIQVPSQFLNIGRADNGIVYDERYSIFLYPGARKP